jgi:superoxide reductase
MTELNQVYRCNVCGNMVVMVRAGAGQLVCCGQAMELLTETLEDQGLEKHVPVIEEREGGVRVKVGSVPHPMEESHFIEWIEVISKDGRSYRKFLKAGVEAMAEFEVKKENIRKVREYCNLHGLWKAE